MPLKPPDFDQWFTASAGVETNGTRFALHQDSGWLWLPSGRLMAWQPVTVPDPDKYAFAQTVSPGRYSVNLLIKEYPGATIEYVAAARLVIRDELAVTWEMAVHPGQDASDLDDESFFGFPVDGGTACFTDAQTMLTLDALEIPDTDGESWFEVLSMDVRDSGASLTTLTDPGQNEAPVVVGFSTGDGDGRYPTWVGRTAQGEITCFATDFMLRGTEPCSISQIRLLGLNWLVTRKLARAGVSEQTWSRHRRTLFRKVPGSQPYSCIRAPQHSRGHRTLFHCLLHHSKS